MFMFMVAYLPWVGSLCLMFMAESLSNATRLPTDARERAAGLVVFHVHAHVSALGRGIKCGQGCRTHRLVLKGHRDVNLIL